jgi:hypothetical protein
MRSDFLHATRNVVWWHSVGQPWTIKKIQQNYLVTGCRYYSISFVLYRQFRVRSQHFPTQRIKGAAHEAVLNTVQIKNPKRTPTPCFKRMPRLYRKERSGAVFLNFHWAQELIPRIDSASLCGLVGQYDNPIPTRLLAPIGISKITAQDEV